MIKQSDLIFTNIKIQESPFLSAAKKRGDWQGTKDLLMKGDAWILQEITKSGLTGRGGALFPTGLKWSRISNRTPRYLIINADEGEVGSFKDRTLLKHEPHKIIEGALLSSFAIGARVAYIYIRGEYAKEAKILQTCIEEAYAASFLGKNSYGLGVSFDLYIHKGAGAYIAGEESALMESIEGKKAFPRLKPPYPSDVGLYDQPTIINNVETIALVPTILKRGGGWFASFGSGTPRGIKLFCLSGHINNPCVVEETFSVPLRTLIDRYAKGVKGGFESLQAVIPGGISTPLISAKDSEDLSMDHEGLLRVHSYLGTGSIIVINKSVDIIQAFLTVSRFYHNESCGQCSPCREGTGWIYRLLKRFADFKASSIDLEILESLTQNIPGTTICALADAACLPIQGLLRHFRSTLLQRTRLSP